MGSIVNMSKAQKTNRGPNSTSHALRDGQSNSKFSYRLFIIVDDQTFTLIEQLRESLEAHSIGDVVRQAVRACAIAFVESKSNSISEGLDLVARSDPPQENVKLKRLNVRVPIRTKERLDQLKSATGKTYTDIITCGLAFLAQKAREEDVSLEEFSEKVVKCSNINITNNHDNRDDESHHPSMSKVMSC